MHLCHAWAGQQARPVFRVASRLGNLVRLIPKNADRNQRVSVPIRIASYAGMIVSNQVSNRDQDRTRLRHY
jgi:hypothetical protein